MLATWLIAITIAGPIANMQENIREASTSFVCFKQLTQNRTTLMNNLVNGPAIQMLKNMKANEDKIKKIGDVLSDAEGQRSNRSALQKSQDITDDYRSLMELMAKANATVAPNEIPDQVVLSCAAKVSEIDCTPENVCASNSSNASKMCIEDEKENRTCLIVRDEMVANCSETEKLGDYGKKLKEFEDASIDMDASFTGNISLDLNVDFNVSFDASIPLKEDIRQLARRRRAFLEAMKTVYSYVVSFLLFASLLSAYTYRKKYVNRISSDNIYITKYFDHIDERRQRAGKITVIPLKDLDRRPDLIRPNRLKQGPAEKARTRSNFVIWFLVLIVLLNILYLDHIMSFTISSFSRHGNITFRDFGSHNVSVVVIGTGPFAEAIRDAYNSFNHTETLDSTVNSSRCLPLANSVTTLDYFWMSLIMFLWFLLNFTDAYLLRLKRSICAFFYPDRERERNLHLYNEVLKGRRKGLKYMLNRYNKDKAAGRIDERKLVGVCQLCQEPPPAGEELMCEYCYNNERETVYCSQCWYHAIRRHCLVCGDWKKAVSMHSMVTEDKATGFLRPASATAPKDAPGAKNQ